MKPLVEIQVNLDGVWSMVILIGGDGLIELDRNGDHVLLPYADVLRRDLLWPNGRVANMLSQQAQPMPQQFINVM